MESYNSTFQQVYEKLSNFKWDREASSREFNVSFQLPTETRQYAGKGRFPDHGRYAFLFKNNKYWDLYRYLQTDPEFLNFQANEIKLLMGLFAYVDDKATETGLRYLYGPMDLNIDQDKPKPHFYLKSFAYTNGTCEAHAPAHFAHIMESFYYARSEVHWKKLYFIQMLENDPRFQHKRTSFEKSNSIIYAPSGEMDGCILMWIFCILDNRNRVEFLKKIVQAGRNNCTDLSMLNTKPITLDFKLLKPKNVVQEDYFIPYENQEYSLFRWFHLFGLLQLDEGRNDWSLTERGIRLLKWLEIYLKSIVGQTNEPFKNYHGILEKIGAEKNDNPELIHNYWLQNIKQQRMLPLLSDFEAANQTGWTKKATQHLFLKTLTLMLVWKEPGTQGKLDRIESFQERCRFNLYSHFVLRSGMRFNIEETSRAWIVFPVITATVDKEKDPKKLEHAGFFLGTFKDSTAQDGEKCGYFENLSLDGYESELKGIIFKTKVIIGKLAEIENHEIYYNGIFEESISREFFYKLKHAQHSFLRVMDILAEELPATLRPTFELARDSLGKYLDIAQHLPNKLMQYIERYPMKPCSLTTLIYEVKTMIHALFSNDEIALMLFRLDDEPMLKPFKERAATDTLIHIEAGAAEQNIRLDKGLATIIIKELFVNAVRNTPIYDPRVIVKLSGNEDQATLIIENEYKRGGFKKEERGLGITIIDELIKGFNWKSKVINEDKRYKRIIHIPKSNKDLVWITEN